jgi:hypothetical protein
MAYGLRYRLEYKDRNEVLTQINIYRRDYTGTADVRYAPAAFKAEWGDQGSNDTLPPCIYGSSVTVYLDAEIDFEFLNLFSADAKKHLVEIKKGGVVFGKWFIEPDTWNEPLTATPYPCQFTAYDNLGFLKNIDFDAIDEFRTIESIITDLLELTGLGLSINFNINFLDETSTDYKSHLINTIDFAEMNCFDVLQQVAVNCRIYQRGGAWHVVSNKKINQKPITYTDFWQEGEANLDVIAAIKQLRLTQDFGYKANVLSNGSFVDYNAELAKFATWENINITPVQQSLNDDGDKFVYLYGQQYPGRFNDGGYGQLTKFIRKTLPVNQTTSQVTFETKFALMGTKYSCYMFMRITLHNENANYYLRYKPWTDETSAEFIWKNFTDNFPFNDADLMLTLKSHLEVSHASGKTGKYYNTYDKVTAIPFQKIADNFETFKASVAGLPISGDLRIDLFVPYTDRSQISGSCFTGVKMNILDEQAEEYPTKREIKVINDLNNNAVPDEITLKIGDYPEIVNNKIIFNGGIQRANGETTHAWGYPGATTLYSFSEFIARNLAAQSINPRYVFKAKLCDIIPVDIIVVEDVNIPGKIFVETALTYDDDTQACEGNYVEQVDNNIDLLIVENTTSLIVIDPLKNATEKSAKTVNTTKTVQLIDDAGALTSSPAYLSDSDFELKATDVDSTEEDGFARIQLKKAAINSPQQAYAWFIS